MGRAQGHASVKRAVKEIQSVASSVLLSAMGKKVCVSGKPSNNIGFPQIDCVHQHDVITQPTTKDVSTRLQVFVDIRVQNKESLITFIANFSCSQHC